jgi:hypothetical protein
MLYFERWAFLPRLIQALVHLYEALGGGWVESAEEQTQDSINDRL